jgi:hypothetical protein
VIRRDFLTLLLGGFVAAVARGRAGAEPVRRSSPYEVEVGLLYNVLSLRLTGTLDESVDRNGGRYAVIVAGEGLGLATRVESSGALRNERWTPLRTGTWFDVSGREARSEIRYEPDAHRIEIQARSVTFFRRRERILNDVLTLPGPEHVDDVVSAMLNYADGRWPAGPGGVYRTVVVRRRRRDDEGPDDVERTYEGELTPVVLQVKREPDQGGKAGPKKTSATFDLAPFSSWARPGRPSAIMFGPDRRPESITCPMILGTSLAIRFGAV